MNVLIIAAHPDDEVLGVGGTILKHVKNRDDVYCLILTDGAEGCYEKGKGKKLITYAEKCAKQLGIKKLFLSDLPNQRLDKVPSLTISREIEKVIAKVKPSVVYTHNRTDINQDHKAVFDATIIATRPLPDSTIKKILCYEVLSSTDWNTKDSFKPNMFVDIENFVKKKIKAFSVYKTEIKKYPHSRSLKGIEVLAQYRGICSGMNFAEAFEIIRERI